SQNGKSPLPGIKRAVTNCWWAGDHSSLLRPSQAHCSFLRDALHRASPNAKGLGQPQDTHTLGKLLSHLSLGRPVDLRPAELHALGDRSLEAGFDSLADHCALKLSERAG